MIHIYCTSKHGHKKTLCPDCFELNEYAMKRLGRCKFGEKKPNCKNCPVHCYKPDMRIKIQEVMRFAGPRMLLHSPILSIIHLLKNFRQT